MQSACLKSANCGPIHCNIAASFDHLVGDREQLVWNGEAERLRSLEVDDQLELRRLLHRHIGRLLSLEYATDIYSHKTKSVGDVSPVAHQAAGRRVVAPLSNGGDGILGGQSCDLAALIKKVRIASNHNCADTSGDQVRK